MSANKGDAETKRMHKLPKSVKAARIILPRIFLARPINFFQCVLYAAVDATDYNSPSARIRAEYPDFFIDTVKVCMEAECPLCLCVFFVATPCCHHLCASSRATLRHSADKSTGHGTKYSISFQKKLLQKMSKALRVVTEEMSTGPTLPISFSSWHPFYAVMSGSNPPRFYL
jgi:hypothetical protein